MSKKRGKGHVKNNVNGKSSAIRKDIFDRWTYKGSTGHEIRFNGTFWNILID